jgi:hypothetical protein
VFIITALVYLTFKLLGFYLVKYFSAYLLMQFLVGTSYPMMYLSSFAIVVELCGKGTGGTSAIETSGLGYIISSLSLTEHRSLIYSSSWAS